MSLLSFAVVVATVVVLSFFRSDMRKAERDWCLHHELHSSCAGGYGYAFAFESNRITSPNPTQGKDRVMLHSKWQRFVWRWLPPKCIFLKSILHCIMVKVWKLGLNEFYFANRVCTLLLFHSNWVSRQNQGKNHSMYGIHIWNGFGLVIPWEEGSTVTSVLPSATGFGVSFPIWLNCILLGALVTFPLLLTVLSAEVLLDPS